MKVTPATLERYAQMFRAIVVIVAPTFDVTNATLRDLFDAEFSAFCEQTYPGTHPRFIGRERWLTYDSSLTLYPDGLTDATKQTALIHAWRKAWGLPVSWHPRNRG